MPVGFFDSGVGGTCILEAFRHICPNESTVYIADSAHCPYGNKSKDEIIALADANTRTLLDAFSCKMIVVACNTATASAIDYLRAKYPDTPFIGIEPAVKPAALESRSGVVGVLATAGTFSGRLYNETKAKFAKDVTIIATVADEFVTLAEQGRTDGAEVEAIVRRRLAPLLDAGADRIVLGCTHFPHLKNVMERVCAGRAKIIDPSLAVARQARRILAQRGLAAPDGCAADDTRISSLARTVLVTGGVKRIGKAIADHLAAEGWHVIRSSHREGAGADIVCDLSREGGADALFAAATAHSMRIAAHPLDAIVNNAAVYLSDAETTRRVNLAAPLRLAELLAQRHNDRDSSVVNIIDAAILRNLEETRPAFREYAAAKRELLAATLADAKRFAGEIRVNGVAPGSVLAPDGIREKALPSNGARRPTPLDVARKVRHFLETPVTSEIAET